MAHHATPPMQAPAAPQVAVRPWPCALAGRFPSTRLYKETAVNALHGAPQKLLNFASLK